VNEFKGVGMSRPNKSMCHQYNLRSKAPRMAEESPRKKDEDLFKKRKTQEINLGSAHKKMIDKETVPLNQKKKTDNHLSNVAVRPLRPKLK
jgi:hypothetical protein